MQYLYHISYFKKSTYVAEFDNSQLIDSLNKLNTFDQINDLLINQYNLNSFVNDSNIVADNNCIDNNKISISVSDDGYIQVEITTELTNG